MLQEILDLGQGRCDDHRLGVYGGNKDRGIFVLEAQVVEFFGGLDALGQSDELSW